MVAFISCCVLLLLCSDLAVLDCSAPLRPTACLCILAVGVHIVRATQSRSVRAPQICGTVPHAQQAEHGNYMRWSASSASPVHFLRASHKTAIFAAMAFRIRRDQRAKRAEQARSRRVTTLIALSVQGASFPPRDRALVVQHQTSSRAVARAVVRASAALAKRASCRRVVQ